MSHLKQYKNITSALEQANAPLNNPLVIHLEEEDEVLYSTPDVPSSKLKLQDDKLVLEDVVVPGFVDLGLSVMWAECNLGASSPEGTGLFYSWGEVEGHEQDPVTKELKDGHVFSESTSNYSTINSDLYETDKDSVKKYYQTIGQQYTEYRIPTVEQVQELLDNTEQSIQHINEVKCYVFTSKINNKSIVIPHVEGWCRGERYVNQLWSGSYRLPNSTNYSSSYAVPFGNYGYSKFEVPEDFFAQSHRSCGYQIRGVCIYDPPKNRAQLLDLNNPITVENDKLYCIREGEYTSAVEFVSQNNNPITMYVSAESQFTNDAADTNVDRYYPFFESNGEQKLQLTSGDWLDINSITAERYIYIKFSTSSPTVININSYVFPEDVDTSILVVSGRKIVIPKSKPENLLFRFRYNDWKGYDITFDWKGQSSLSMYIADACKFMLSSPAQNVLQYEYINRKSIYTLPSETLDLWVDNVDDNGFIYARFKTTVKGNLIITSSRNEL